jgi:Xaa-Pro aminopeptidase
MLRDEERIERVAQALDEAGLDAVIVALPTHVLMLSGYWPVVGTSLAIALRDRRLVLVVPKDEVALAATGFADEILSFSPGSLDRLNRASHAIVGPLTTAIPRLGLTNARIGVETGEFHQPASYASMHLYGGSMRLALESAAPKTIVRSADKVLDRLAAKKTHREIERVRIACRSAEHAFRQGAARIAVGVREIDAAIAFRDPLFTWDSGQPIARADGHIFCMSGPNSGSAFGSHARSTTRSIARGDLVLVHCNSTVDGYWTDVTRTYSMGLFEGRVRAMYEAIFAARSAGLAAVHVGAKAMAVDAAVRSVLEDRGFGSGFKHSTGHGVGFSAIDHSAVPRLHPRSPDTLGAGMIFNIEPAIYIEGFGGIRHCNMVALREGGPEILTPFQDQLEEMIIGG